MSYIMIAGHITADATQKQVNTANGMRYVTTFTVADNGNPNRPEFYRFSAWANQPSKLAQFARKGRAVCCTGSNLKASPYTDRNGKPAASLDLTLDNITWMDANRTAQAVEVPEVAIPNMVPAEAVTEGQVVLPF